ncbi:uncharacterized protein FMAN_04247 [Fusarium mangiferae]|uniref:Uncharacterized protein n=1 Tax=Fusarium mangiferae TaxID=192010 RepID=A0A1L7T2K6_FUSMA|nr:uncharacterized protein FMAN_04247 [Fusarium mangiferae]CVK89551.1 uncharacterized protein FMAN_04247 [Fusarium mangiferae]
MDNDPTMDSTGFQFQANSTSKWDNELKFAAAGSVRTSIIVLSVFNVIVAFAVTISILLRSWRTLKQVEPIWDFKSSWFRLVKGRDVYPFVLSLGIVVQGIVYATAQAKGLESLMILGCATISRMMLLAFFIVPFIQMLFGLELTIRITRPSIFPFRGKFNTLACLVTIGILLIIVFSITFAVLPSEFCFASLISFLHRYDAGCFGVLLTVILIVLIECGVICFKLHTGARMRIVERDEASRMVYHMIIAVISYTLQITFFYNTAFRDTGAADDTSMTLNMIGTVVMNMSGLLLGCLYLFLRSSRSPTGCSDDDIEASQGFRKWGDDQDQEPPTPGSAMLQPLDLPKLVRKAESKEDLALDDRVEDKVFGARKDFLNRGLKPLRLGSMRNSGGLPTAPKPVRTSSKESIKNFKRSMYSIFPKAEPPKSPILLPTTTYKDSTPKKTPALQNLADELLAPPALRLPDKRFRSSGASMLSTATVQIGLRLSNIGDMRPAKPELKLDTNTNQVHDLDCPNSTVRFFPRKTSPLAIAIVDVPGEGTRYKIQDNFDERLSEKELPPVPLSAGMNTPPETTLSSAVYSPQEKTPISASHNPRAVSVSSVRAHSRQGSRNMGEPSRLASRQSSRIVPEIGRMHSRQGSRVGPDTGRVHSRQGSRVDLEATKGKGPWI